MSKALSIHTILLKIKEERECTSVDTTMLLHLLQVKKSFVVVG